jgi:hypothetical protein
VRSCNSSSLNLFHTRSGPNITDYLQIINTVTGNCMTWSQYNWRSYITFEPCNHAPTVPTQLFVANQTEFESYPKAALGLATTQDWVFGLDDVGHVMASDSTDERLAVTTFHGVS